LVLAQPQPDWSRNTIVTGFTFYDGDQNMVKLAPELQQFLKTGEAPIVFTLVLGGINNPMIKEELFQ
jgi:rhamnosyltransferase subunit B